MAVVTFPDSLSGVVELSWSQQRRDLSYGSVFGSQAVEIAAPLWAVTLAAPQEYDASAGAWQSLLMKLRGKTNQLELWNFVRPVPLGTMRGTMILSVSAVQGDTSLSISSAGEGGETLLQGDYLGVGSGITQQVVMVTENATADVNGNISVTIEPPIRNAIATGSPPGAAVTWSKPKALFRATQSKFGWSYGSTLVNGISLDLIEDWRP